MNTTVKQYVADFTTDPAYTVRKLAYDPTGLVLVGAYMAEHGLKYELQRLVRLLDEYINNQVAVKERVR